MSYDKSRILDYDLDGHLDFFVTHDGGNEEYYRGNGSTGGFTKGFSANLGTYTHQLDVGEFNGDGKIDVVTGSNKFGSADDKRYVRLNSLSPGAGGNFSGGWTSSTSQERGSGNTLVADFDGDNDYDMVTPRNSSASDRKAFVRINDGSGSSYSIALEVSGALPAMVLDIDNDDDTDVVLNKYDGSGKFVSLLFYKNDGNAKFSLAQDLAAGGGGVFGDVDGDGFKDLVVLTSDYSNGVKVYRNDGAGQFINPWTAPEAGSVSRVYLRDYDNDGDPDIILSRGKASGNAERTIAFLRNGGSGVFAEEWKQSVVASTNYQIYAMGDLDGAPARGILVSAEGVQVTGFAAIRGFSTGVEITGDQAEVSDVVVDAPDLYGVLFSDVASGTVAGIEVTNLHHGVGLGLLDADNVTVDDSSFCDAGYDYRLVALSSYCVGSTGLAGSGNRVKLNNGCSGIGWISCK